MGRHYFDRPSPLHAQPVWDDGKPQKDASRAQGGPDDLKAFCDKLIEEIREGRHEERQVATG